MPFDRRDRSLGHYSALGTASVAADVDDLRGGEHLVTVENRWGVSRVGARLVGQCSRGRTHRAIVRVGADMGND